MWFEQTSVNHDVKRGWTESSAQPQHIYCCYSHSDFLTRAQVKNYFSLLSAVQCSLLYELHLYFLVPSLQCIQAMEETCELTLMWMKCHQYIHVLYSNNISEKCNCYKCFRLSTAVCKWCKQNYFSHWFHYFTNVFFFCLKSVKGQLW